MKSLRKKWLMACVTLLMLFCFTGCGAEVSTQLQFDDAFSGERVMTCVVSRSDAEEYFEGGIDGVDTVIAESCPGNLQYEKEDAGSDVIYTFTLSFDSFDDYKSQVEAILGRPSEMTFRQPESVFSSGVALEEDFTSLDILGWFKAVVEEYGLMSDPADLWELTGTKVIYQDEEFSTNSTIRLDLIESNPVSEIQVLTEAQEDGVERTIVFDMPLQARDAKKEEVDAYMENLVPEGETGTWKQTGSSYLFTIHLTASSLDELVAEMSQVFVDGYLCEDLVDDQDPFVTYHHYLEKFGVSSFGDAENGALWIKYQSEFFNLENRTLEALDSTGWLQGNQYIYNGYANSVEVNMKMTESSVAEEVALQAILTEEGALDAQVDIRFPAGETAQAEKAARYYGQLWEDVNVSVVSEDGEICRIQMNAAECPVSERLMAVLDVDSVVWDVGKDEGFFQNTYTVSLDANVGWLARRAGIETATANVSLTSPHKWKEATLNGEMTQELGDQTSIQVPGVDLLTLTATASQWNVANIVVALLLAALLAAALAWGAVRFLRHAAQRDGRQDEPMGEVAKDYLAQGCRSAKTGTLALTDLLSRGLNRLNRAASGLFRSYYPDGANQELVNYFYGSRWPLLIGCVSVLFLLLGLEFLYKQAGRFCMTVGEWGIVLAVLWFLIDRYRNNPEAEAEYDRVFAENMQRLKDGRGLEQLGLVPEQVSLAEPLKLMGPDYDKADRPVTGMARVWKLLRRLFWYEDRLVIKRGADGKLRYSCLSQDFWYFSENQLYRYEVAYDMCTSKIRAESTCEMFYQDLNVVSQQEQTVKIRSFRKDTSNIFQSFVVTTGSGNSLSASIDSGYVRDEELTASVKAMQNLARDRKAVSAKKRNKRRSKLC